MSDRPEVLDPATLPPAPEDYYPCESTGHEVGKAVTVPITAVVQHPATWLEAAFIKWHVPYRVVAGWQDRGRPLSSGGFNPGGVILHHTGTASSATNPNPALGVVTNGRADLAGPLCQVSTGYDGVTTIVAAGRANHAGRAKAAGTQPAGDGNTLWIGNEIQTSGTQTIPDAQYEGIIRSTAAILDHLGTGMIDTVLHYTTSYDGKWDLGGGPGMSGKPANLTSIRNDVAAALAAGPQEVDMDAAEHNALMNVQKILTQLEDQIPEQWMKPDPSDPTGQRYMWVPKGTAGATLATVLNSLAGNSLQVNIGGVDERVAALIPKIADAVVAKLPPSSGGSAPTAQQVADAVAQEFIARGWAPGVTP